MDVNLIASLQMLCFPQQLLFNVFVNFFESCVSVGEFCTDYLLK